MKKPQGITFFIQEKVFNEKEAIEFINKGIQEFGNTSKFADNYGIEKTSISKWMKTRNYVLNDDNSGYIQKKQGTNKMSLKVVDSSISTNKQQILAIQTKFIQQRFQEKEETIKMSLTLSKTNYQKLKTITKQSLVTQNFILNYLIQEFLKE